MFASLSRNIKGYVKIRITGYSPERFINACRHRNIILWGLLYRKGSYEMYTTIQGFKKLKPVIRKTGTKVTILGRFGLPFFLYKYRNRKMFFAGAVISICLIYVFSLFVWDIKVTGNIRYSDEALIKYLEQTNVKHGMLKKNLECAEIVKAIRKNYDDIIWVSASIQGTQLLIQIKENETLEQEKILTDKTYNTKAEGTNIISTEDCIIKEIITRKGNPLVAEGTEVKAGDVLVTGLIEVLNDNKELIGYQTEIAQADIRGQLECDYENKESIRYEKKEYLEPTKEEIYLRIKNQLFWLGSKKNQYKEAESVLVEKQIRIGDAFYLPLYYGYKRTKPYRLEKKEYTQEDMQMILTDNFNKYCNELVKKGVEIIENSVKIYTESNFAIAKGKLTIICDIGEEKSLQIPELPMEEDLNGND